MRRLIAHIGLALTALVLVGTTYTKVVSNVDSNIEFKNGKQLVFRATPKNSTYEDLKDGEVIEEDDLKSIAKEMETRLDKSNVSRYKVITEGADTIKVILAQESDNDYERIKTYLSFNGSFALTTSTDTVALGSEFLTSGSAYLDSINGYPAVVIPFDNDSSAYKAVYEEAKRQSENGEGETTQNDEGEDVTTTYMYFWYDYIEGYDVYSKTVETNSDYDKAVASKILMKFNFSDPYFPKSDENAPDKLYSAINIDADGDKTASPAEVSSAYNTGRYFVNLLNATELAGHVEFIYSETADIWVDEIVALGAHETVAFSNTFKAILIGIVVVGLLLAIFYRFGSLSASTISLVATFLGICVLGWLKVEFSVAALFGILGVAVASVAAGIVYLNKLKEECYRGRSLRKANSEALRRSILPIVDIHVVLMILGAFAYVFGGPLMRSFAAVAVLGGLGSLLLNAIALPAMMFLATNATYLNGKYEWFGVSKEQVPNLMNEEKQTYFGTCADKDFTKHKKPAFIAAALLLVGFIGGTVAFGIANKGTFYQQANKVTNSEIFIEMDTSADENSVLETVTREQFLTVAKDLTIGEAKLESYVKNIELYNRSDVVSTKNGNTTIYYSYYVVSLTKSFTGEESATYNGTTDKLSILLSNDNLDRLGFNSDLSLSLKTGEVVSKDQPSFAPIMISTLVGVAVATVYLMLRYRLSRGLATLVVTLATGILTAGLFIVIHIAVGSYVLVATPLACLIAFIFEIILMNKEREMINEDKKHDNSIENRNEIMVNATKYSCTPIIYLLGVLAFLFVIFFGFGPSATAYIYLNLLFGLLIGSVSVLTMFGPLAQFFYKLFFGVKIERPTSKKSKKKQKVNKSAEPEEAVFIGIND